MCITGGLWLAMAWRYTVGMARFSGEVKSSWLLHSFDLAAHHSEAARHERQEESSACSVVRKEV